MTFVRGAALAACVAALVGCGNAGSFNGKVDDRPLSVQDAIVTQLYNNDGERIGVSVLLSDQPNLCDSLKAGRLPKNMTEFALDLVRLDSNQTALAMDTGDFQIVTQTPGIAGNFSMGWFYKTGSDCKTSILAERSYAKTGLVKVSDYKEGTDGFVHGTFDITVGDQGDKVTGSFSADWCDLSQVAEVHCE